MNLVSRIAGAARLLATGKLAQSMGFEGAQMQRRVLAWRAGAESINSLMLQGGELQRARARPLVRTNPNPANATASFAARSAWADCKARRHDLMWLGRWNSSGMREWITCRF